jgi:hypothetical protein
VPFTVDASLLALSSARCPGAGGCDVSQREHLIAFSAPFYTENDHFTKTGSGQTWGKLKK